MSNLSATTHRCLGLVATPLIRPDGGRPNISAKTLATLWYLLILPDAQKRLQGHLHQKRLPWYSVSRMLGVVVAATNVVAMPLSWGLLFAGKRNASRVAAMGVLMNPPSFQLSYLLASELSLVLVKRVCMIGRGIAAFVKRPFKRGGETGKEEGKA